MASEVEIHGYCEDRFEPVKKVLADSIKSGNDIGASFAATINGEYVVDIWGGYSDAAKTQPWERDTIVNVFSTTKVMSVLCVLMLVDRDLIDLDAPVAKYWPEFAQNGKENLPVRYLLSHTAGLPGFSKVFKMKTLYDWDRIVNILAAQPPSWKPGTRSGYHAITQGYLLGELVRRVTHKTIGKFSTSETKAKILFEKVSRYSNHLGLFSESIDLMNHEPAGNLPHAQTHIAFISAAVKLSGEEPDIRPSQARFIE